MLTRPSGVKIFIFNRFDRDGNQLKPVIAQDRNAWDAITQMRKIYPNDQLSVRDVL